MLFKLRTSIKAYLKNIIKAKISQHLILKRETYIIRKALKQLNRKLYNLTLNNVIIVKGFYINIILKTYLLKVIFSFIK